MERLAIQIVRQLLCWLCVPKISFGAGGKLSCSLALWGYSCIPFQALRNETTGFPQLRLLVTLLCSGRLPPAVFVDGFLHSSRFDIPLCPTRIVKMLETQLLWLGRAVLPRWCTIAFGGVDRASPTSTVAILLSPMCPVLSDTRPLENIADE